MTPKTAISKMSFLVCFPRSGSNFIQNVIRQSGVVDAVSIYKPKLKENLSRNFKSHAPTPGYLQDEARRFLSVYKEEFQTIPIIWLYRDPRDAMISFFEYTCTRLGYSLKQDHFIKSYDFFLAAPIDKRCERRSDTYAISVIDSYKKSIIEWHQHCADNKAFAVNYEDLLSNPNESFYKIFELLNSSRSVSIKARNELVSLHSSESRLRGQAHGWRTTGDKYKIIIDAVNSKMSEELQLLEYKN